MKKTIISMAMALLLLIPGCGSSVSSSARFTVATTTYPLYLLTQMVTEGVDDVEIVPVINQPISCPHDYTLSVNDMKKIEQSDVLIQNGLGLEPFLSDVMDAYPDLPVMDASDGISLLPYQGHDTETAEDDPHIWMDPNRAAQMVETIGSGLSDADPVNSEAYQANAAKAAQELREYANKASSRLSGLTCRELITFHDGFGYMANAFGLTIVKSIEEEAGSEVSAKEISDIVALIQEHKIPAVFYEENGSDSAANTIAQETGIQMGALTLMMNGSTERETPNAYYTLMDRNIDVLLQLLQPDGGQS